MSAPKSPGRPKGAKNKQTLDVKELARDYTEEAILALASVMRGDDTSAKVSAAKELLDRGHGKAKQVVDANVTGTIEKLTRTVVDPKS
jgi:hypothetical protein